jgi:cell shape-determining protein MreC
LRPPVISSNKTFLRQFKNVMHSGNRNALSTMEHPIQFLSGSPKTFASYARTLPAVKPPLCWKKGSSFH